ncbi:hypothetical protein DM01DRAFT_1408661 [Hesseltinella vesiculosa]|uniref:Uncharacterized protein n=1 Tax=Hesseltinella vesiculosa TaxID=101127 RepID=A0A1X2GE85_9FUNG|nr:hypothetical protein DM01DRAFT_1408661 [Hesseltinella vesiculosa]
MNFSFNPKPLWNKINPKKIKSRRRGSTGSKSVRFSDACSSVYYTYGSCDYDRGSTVETEDIDVCEQLRSLEIYEEDADFIDFTDEDLAWDEEVRKNTKINMKRMEYSVAVLIQYRSSFR